MRETSNYRRFNHNQRHALDGGRNLAVRANAGSGKTRVLVERIVQLLARSFDEGEPPLLTLTQIAALTFTRKAAAQLQERLRDTFREMADTTSNAKEKDYWKDRIEELPRAMIGTIDSFCARALREFSVLDTSPERIEPDFEPLDPYETILLKREAIDRVINRLGAESAGAEAEACRWWAVEQGYDSLIRHLTTLLDHLVDPEIIRAAHDGVEPAARRVARAWDSLPAVVTLQRERASLRDDIRQMLTTIEEHKKANKTLLDLHEDLVVMDENIGTADMEHDQQVLDALAEMLLTQKGESRSLKNYAAVADIMGPLQETWQPLLRSFDFDEQAERYALEAADRLARLLSPVHAEYLHLCREANRYDFTTLARRTLALVRRVDVTRRLKERFRHILVDEFQDTNRLQWEIIAHLVGSGPGGLLDRDRLFVVGDPQQSIYRFRQADVAVFRAVQDSIHTSNTHHGFADAPTDYDRHQPQQPSDSDQRLGQMPLGENYRSLTPMPLALVDRVFAWVFDPKLQNFDPKTYSFEVEYQKLLPGLTDEPCGEVRYAVPADDDGRDDDGEERDEDEEVEDLGTAQVRAVVDQLVELHGQPRLMSKDDEGGAGDVSPLLAEQGAHAPRSPRTLSWRDMAVLLPSRTTVLTQIEDEFRARGVPFVVTGGIGFWQRQEVIDVINLASFLADRGDELALFALLRSPLGQLTDTEILFLSQLGMGSLWRGLRYVMQAGEALNPDGPDRSDGSETNVWRAVHWSRLPDAVRLALQEFWAPYPGNQKEKLRKTARLFDTWRRRVDRMAHADLLQRSLEESGAYALYAGGAEGPVMLANLERLFDHIRALEVRSAPDINRLARHLHVLRDEVENEQQATLARDTDAVQIMTVHAAKGLEFPVVAVLKMERRAARGGRAALMVKSPWDGVLAVDSAAFGDIAGGTIAVSVRHPQRPRGDLYKPQLLRALRRLDQAQELAESRRLFYVAGTRAQERLILAGKEPAKRQDGSPRQLPICWQLWFEEALGISGAHKQAGKWEDASSGQKVQIITEVRDLRPPAVPAIEPPAAPVDLAYVHERPLHPLVATTSLEPMRELFRTDRHAWWLRYRLQLRPSVPNPSKIVDLPLRVRELPPAQRQTEDGEGDEPVSVEAGDDAREADDAERRANIGTVVGSMVHRLLEMPGAVFEETPEKLRPLLEALAANLLAADDLAIDNGDGEHEAGGVGVELVAGRVQSILGELRKHWRESQPLVELIKAAGEVEVPFALRFPRWFITGRFDKLLKYGTGYEVVDWKTDAGPDRAAIAEHHRPQMKLYALALHHAGQAVPVDGVVRVHLALLHHLTVETLRFTIAELDEFEKELGQELDQMSAFETGAAV